jgi:hypothetical protein
MITLFIKLCFGLLAIYQPVEQSTGFGITNAFFKENIKLVSATKKIDSTNADWKFYKTQISKWKLTNKQVLTFIQNRKKITSQDWHYKFSVLSSNYVGEVSINNKTYQYELNAGGFLILFYGKEFSYYGCKQRSLKKSFLDWV